MRIIDLLFSKEHRDKGLLESSRKWNLMWDLWCEGTAASPYAELMTYDAEVNNGGHGQYFLNLGNDPDHTNLEAQMAKILPILPPPLSDNLRRAYRAFCSVDTPEYDPEEDEAAFEECDMLFYEKEQLVLDILQAYANTLTLPKEG